jgi:hypothetical protein
MDNSRIKYFEVLAITLVLVCIHFVFSKLVSKVKPKNLDPPREDNRARSSALYFISEDLVFLSVTFTFFFLNDLLHLLKADQPIPIEVKNVSPYVLWFLISLAIVYVGCLHLNRKIDCVKWQISRKGHVFILKARYFCFVTGTILLSIAAISGTFFFTLRITLKIL